MDYHFMAGAILHATAVAVIGFFVLFAAGKAEGIVRLVGHILGAWLWIVAVLMIVCTVAGPMFGMGGKGPWTEGRWNMHRDWMHPMGPPTATPPAQTGAAPAQAQPQAPPPKKP